MLKKLKDVLMDQQYLLIGGIIINPANICTVSLNYASGQVLNCLLITFLDKSVIIFEGEEAEIMRRYFLHGSRALDLRNLYWVR